MNKLQLHQRRHRTLKRLTLIVVVVAVLILGASILRQSKSPLYEQLVQSSLTNPTRKFRAAQITSSFENSTLHLRYDYAEDIGDGNGITAGRAGFTSGTGDLLEVVQNYTKAKPQNSLARYIPPLQMANGTKTTSGLQTFAADWKIANQDPLLHAIQDQEVDRLYFNPAIARANQIGIKTALGQEIIWDTWIQHGGGDKSSGAIDGGDEIIAETRQAMHGNISGNEAQWLHEFLQIRLKHLYHLYASTIDDKDSSKSRVAALQSLLTAKKFSLDPPLTWKAYGDVYTISE